VAGAAKDDPLFPMRQSAPVLHPWPIPEIAARYTWAAGRPGAAVPTRAVALRSFFSFISGCFEGKRKTAGPTSCR
jgi:hypothetical protein